MKLGLLLLVSILALAACDNSGFYKDKQPPRWNKTTISVTWLESDAAVTEKCRELGLQTQGADGCARSSPTDISICEVYAVKPAGFNDSRRLEVFGHEVLHCLGATHD